MIAMAYLAMVEMTTEGHIPYQVRIVHEISQEPKRQVVMSKN